jgi:hypothetical protein
MAVFNAIFPVITATAPRRRDIARRHGLPV